MAAQVRMIVWAIFRFISCALAYLPNKNSRHTDKGSWGQRYSPQMPMSDTRAVSRAVHLFLTPLLVLVFSLTCSSRVEAVEKTNPSVSKSILKKASNESAEAKHTDVHYWACVDDLVEWLAEPKRTIKQPFPDLPPIFFGCQLHGCDLGESSSIDLEFKLSGNLAESVEVDITESPLEASGKAFQMRGKIAPVVQNRRFRITPGVSLLRGVSAGKSGPTPPAQKAVDLTMNPSSGPLSPSAHFRLSWNRGLLEKLVTDATAADQLPGKGLGSFDLTITQKRGPTALDVFRAIYSTKWCRIPTSKVKSDRIHLTHRTKTINGSEDSDFDQSAVVMTNGRAATGWGTPFALESIKFFIMPMNMMTNTNDCQETYNERDVLPCVPEASVFTHGQGMTFRSPVTEWTDSYGDTATVNVKMRLPNIIKVPVQFYILWEHGAPSSPVPPIGFGSCTITTTLSSRSTAASAPLSTRCLAETWWLKANEVLAKMNSGIQLDIPTVTVSPNAALASAGCREVTGNTVIYDHFGFTQDERERPEAVRVYFVENSQDISETGTLFTNTAQTCGSTYYSGYDIDPTYFNEIFISTALANSTTLAHEFGHALSLDDVNQVDVNPDRVKDHANGLDQVNLMWSGSNSRSTMTVAQSFRANVNARSAIHRHSVRGRVLDGAPRECQEHLENKTCPRLTLMPN